MQTNAVLACAGAACRPQQPQQALSPPGGVGVGGGGVMGTLPVNVAESACGTVNLARAHACYCTLSTATFLQVFQLSLYQPQAKNCVG
jgi:hypothetical protein